MGNEGLWVNDPVTGEPVYLYLSELDSDAIQQLLRPVGGFCYSASSFIHLPLPAVPYYIKDWLPKMGKACIYAPAKTGKSFLCIQAARCISAGEDLVGLPTTQGRVLYLQFELGQEVLQARLKSTGKNYDDVFLGTTFSLKLDKKEGQESLRRALEAIEPSVLIIDPLYKCMAGDENESTDMSAVVDFLDTMIDAFRCSILVMHHPGKDIRKGGRGSTVLEDWVDSYIEMRKISKNGETLKVKLTPKLLRHSELPPEPMEVEMKDFEFEPVINEGATTVKGIIREIMSTEKDNVYSPKNFYDAEVGSMPSINNALRDLTQDEEIVRIGQGRYIWKGGEDV